MATLDYANAKVELERLFSEAEEAVANKVMPAVSVDAQQAAETMFGASTQSIREALLGCALARLLDQTIDITLPYVNHGVAAFNGRTLDEQVVNPFLKARQIPSSKGPYLASFRRSVKLDENTAAGIRDKEAFGAMLVYISALKQAVLKDDIEALIRHLLWRFVDLRDKANITLARIKRLSLSQLTRLIADMLGTRSGGRFPVLLTAAMLRTLKRRFELPWEINQQGINAADAASMAGGDINITHVDTGAFVFSVEITERVVDRNRVVSTFTSKISPNGIEDYLFVSTSQPESGAIGVAEQYFAQGHDITFVDVAEWLRNMLATVGAGGRSIFIEEFVDELAQSDIPSEMKVLWNDLIKKLHSPDSY